MSALDCVFLALEVALDAIAIGDARTRDRSYHQLKSSYSVDCFEVISELIGPKHWHSRLLAFEAELLSLKHRRLCYYHNRTRAIAGECNFTAVFTSPDKATAVRLFMATSASGSDVITVSCRTVLSGQHFFLTEEAANQEAITLPGSLQAGPRFPRHGGSKSVHTYYYDHNTPLAGVLALHGDLLASGPAQGKSPITLPFPEVYLEHSRWERRLKAKQS